MARVKSYDIPKGDVRNVTVDFGVTVDNLGASVSSVVWSIDEGNTVTLSGSPTLSTSIATETLTANSNTTGCNVVKAVATMSDSQKVTKAIKINVVDNSSRC